MINGLTLEEITKLTKKVTLWEFEILNQSSCLGVTKGFVGKSALPFELIMKFTQYGFYTDPKDEPKDDANHETLLLRYTIEVTADFNPPLPLAYHCGYQSVRDYKIGKSTQEGRLFDVISRKYLAYSELRNSEENKKRDIIIPAIREMLKKVK